MDDAELRKYDYKQAFRSTPKSVYCIVIQLEVDAYNGSSISMVFRNSIRYCFIIAWPWSSPAPVPAVFWTRSQSLFNPLSDTNNSGQTHLTAAGHMGPKSSVHIFRCSQVRLSIVLLNWSRFQSCRFCQIVMSRACKILSTLTQTNQGHHRKDVFSLFYFSSRYFKREG